MIFDKIECSKKYDALGRVGKVLEMIRCGKLSSLPLGRHDLDGDRVYALVQEYAPKERSAGVWEAHRKYIDVQWMKEGIEVMGWTNIAGLRTRKPYDPAIDVELFDGEGSFLSMSTGDFAVFWPEDAHMPCLGGDSSSAKVKKVVVKVAVE